jgi:DNA polymerase-3 subunit alpha (Gram-positive type)
VVLKVELEQMPPFPNLISDSLLVRETIDYLAAHGGRAPAVRIVDRIMRIRMADRDLAIRLAGDIVERDSRLAMDGECVIFAPKSASQLNLDTASFVVLDLETTGAKAPPCRITEIGAFRVAGGRIEDEFHTLVNPETPIPPFITSLTGIHDVMVADAPTFRSIADDLLGFIGESVLVAHNARFDIGFLNNEIGRVYDEYKLGNPSLCTVQLSRRLLPGIENHRLNTVARYFSIDLFNHHRAQDDARATANIFIHFLRDLKERGMHNLTEATKFSTNKSHVRRKSIAAGESAKS